MHEQDPERDAGLQATMKQAYALLEPSPEALHRMEAGLRTSSGGSRPSLALQWVLGSTFAAFAAVGMVVLLAPSQGPRLASDQPPVPEASGLPGDLEGPRPRRRSKESSGPALAQSPVPIPRPNLGDAVAITGPVDRDRLRGMKPALLAAASSCRFGQGEVLIELGVDSDGRVTKAKVRKGSARPACVEQALGHQRIPLRRGLVADHTVVQDQVAARIELRLEAAEETP